MLKTGTDRSPCALIQVHSYDQADILHSSTPQSLRCAHGEIHMHPQYKHGQRQQHHPFIGSQTTPLEGGGGMATLRHAFLQHCLGLEERCESTCRANVCFRSCSVQAKGGCPFQQLSIDYLSLALSWHFL